MIGAALAVAACQDSRPMESVAERSVVCNGQPDWCLVATSNINRPVYVYLDMKMSGVVLPGKTRRLPATAGGKYLVNYCGVFDIAEQNFKSPNIKKWRCSTPTEMRFDKGDMPLVLEPL